MVKLLILSFIMSLSLSFSSNDKITGFVYDKNTKEYLCGVKVIIGTDTTYTDFNGYFEVIEPKSVENIKLSLISYDEVDLVYIDNQLVVNYFQK